jgi:hypothetical protein
MDENTSPASRTMERLLVCDLRFFIMVSRLSRPPMGLPGHPQFSRIPLVLDVKIMPISIIFGLSCLIGEKLMEIRARIKMKNFKTRIGLTKFYFSRMKIISPSPSDGKNLSSGFCRDCVSETTLSSTYEKISCIVIIPSLFASAPPWSALMRK